MKFQISEKFNYHGIEKISDIWEIHLPWHWENIRYLRNFDTMASRKYQISEKFNYHGIEKISDIWEIQLHGINDVPDIWKIQLHGIEKISDIWEIQLPWHRENIRYLRNFDTMASMKFQISEKFSSMASRKSQISGKFSYLNIEKISDIWEISTSEHRENPKYLGNSAIWTSRKYQISKKFIYHDIEKISSDIRYMRNFDIWTSIKYQISEKFSYLDIEKISDIWEIQLPWHRENIRYLGNSTSWHR